MPPKKLVFNEDGEDATMQDAPPSNQGAVTDNYAAVVQAEREEDMVEEHGGADEEEEEEEEEEQRVRLVSFCCRS